MTIVITHFDRYYEESGGQDYDGIRKTIATRIKDYLKCDPISPSIIYPVCGKWACMVGVVCVGVACGVCFIG